MKVIICQASKDEHGNFSGGVAGDQTGKEVFRRDWYPWDWHTMLRPKSEELAKRSAEAAIFLCDCNYVGYDQKQRNSLHTALFMKKYQWEKLHRVCETDCSAFLTACALCGGARTLEYVHNAPTTRNMVQKFTESGYYEAYHEEEYLTSPDHLRVGDILVKDGHTIMVVEILEDEDTN